VKLEQLVFLCITQGWTIRKIMKEGGGAKYKKTLCKGIEREKIHVLACENKIHAAQKFTIPPPPPSRP